MRTGILTLALLLVLAAGAGAAAPVTLPGAPLSVAVGPLGQCQSSYVGLGNNFYPAEGALGDCGFFLGFPERGNPAFLQKQVFGFHGVQGPDLSAQYTPLSQGLPTGTGTPSDPYEQLTTFKLGDTASAKEGDYVLVEETTSYVDGQAQFRSTFDVENVTGRAPTPGLSPAPAASLRFQAIYAGDLLTGGSDFGTGVLLAGPPLLVGGQDEASGVLGGLVQAPPPSPPWASYEAGCWNVVPEPEGRCANASASDGGIWAAVRAASGEAPAFNDVIDPASIDDGAGVSWGDHLAKPLAPGERATYSIVNRADVPSALSVTPLAQSQTVGQTATITVAATDTAGVPYANRPIVYTIGAANPKSGSVLTDASGVATLSYTGTAVGADALALFLDLNGSGTRTPRDPAAAAQIAWTAAPATASSRFELRSVHVARDGTITIVLVPSQDGTASVAVTAPTATISRDARNARRLACRRSQAVVKGRCRPRSTVSGSVSASGHGGIALKLTVRSSAKVRRALAGGRKVELTAKLTYRSKLGGIPTTRTLHLTVRPTSRKRR